MGFGSYFRDLRIEKQITQKQIADVIKKKPMLVSNVENGKNGPFSDNDLKKIVSFLELSKDEERQLYKEAAKARGKLPQEMQAYIIKNDEAYYLLEILARNELGSESLSQISLIDKIYFEKHAIPYEYPVATTVVRKKKKIGRNEPCPCGSGKKFKKCCIEKGIYD